MENTLYQILVKQNSWWLTGKVSNPKALLPQRKFFGGLVNLLGKPRILALLGARRTGKTVAVWQLIKYLLNENKIAPENIGYVLCDDPEIELYLQSHTFGEIIDGFLEGKQGKKCYLFLDEVQYLSNWAKWLKKYYELYPQLKVIITGSSALHLAAGSRESLVGRLIEKEFNPLDFDEYVSIKKEMAGNKVQINFPQGNIFQKIDWLLSHPSEQVKLTNLFKPEFNHYLLYGGFPESLTEPDINIWQEYLKEDVVKRQIYHDIVKIFKIENPSLLENLLIFIGSHQAEVFSWESFLKALPFGSKETVVNYLSYLTESYLVNCLLKYSSSPIAKQKKYFLTDNGLANMIVGRKNLYGEENRLGHVVEALISQQATKIWKKVFFYRDDKGREVDLIIKTEKTALPIEVKYREKFEDKELSGLIYFMNNYKSEQGLVLTKNILDKKIIEGKKVYFLPVWEFLAAGVVA